MSALEHPRPITPQHPPGCIGQLWLLLLIATAVIAMTIAAAYVHKVQAGIAAGVFALAIVIAGLAFNAPLWRATKAQAGVSIRAMLQHNTFLNMLSYLWGAAALFAIYLGTPVRWQHGWQYGSGLLLIAIGHMIYQRHLANAGDDVAGARAFKTTVALAFLQAVALAGLLVYLIAVGALASAKGDWAANQIFFAGAIAIMCVSLMIVRSYRALAHDPARG
jgi:hypothetical protein